MAEQSFAIPPPITEQNPLNGDETTSLEAQFNPFLMHPSFSSISALVNQPLTGADNYNFWKRAILIALSGRNKEGFLTGEIEKPTNSRSLLAWKCNNDVIASWILNSVSKSIAASIVYTGSVKEIWDELSERFKESNGPQIFSLRKALVTIVQGTQSVESYFTQMKTIWQDLYALRPSEVCTCGSMKPLLSHLESEYTIIFLMGLNDTYGAVRTQILLMEPLPSINKVFSLVVQEERQRTAANSSLSSCESMVLLADSSKSGSHNQRKEQTRPICSHCGKKGHTAEKSYRLHGFPPGFKFRSSSSNQRNESKAYESNPITATNMTANVNSVVQIPSTSTGSSANFFLSLNTEQCSHLMRLLSSHLNTANDTSVNHVAGQEPFEDDWQG